MHMSLSDDEIRPFLIDLLFLRMSYKNFRVSRSAENDITVEKDQVIFSGKVASKPL